MYTAAAFGRSDEENLYRSYITESLRLLAQGQYLSVRYEDLLNPPDEIDVDAIVSSVIEHAGLEVIE